jgi:hypothetical protein
MRAGIAMVFAGATGIAVSRWWSGLGEHRQAALVGVILVVSGAAYFLVSKVIAPMPTRAGLRFMREHAGIEKVFPSLVECKDEMQRDFAAAKETRMLLQIGRREIGASGFSYFYDLAKDKKTPSASLRVLHASDASPFLSRARAEARGSDFDRWQEDVRRLRGEIDALIARASIRIEKREHGEPYLWRIFIFDGVAYVSGYLRSRDADTSAPVYKFREGENSLFAVFKKYFDYLWIKYEPPVSMEAPERWARWE